MSLKDVTALHGAEINEAVSRVVNGGWYLHGKENEESMAVLSKPVAKDYSPAISCLYTGDSPFRNMSRFKYVKNYYSNYWKPERQALINMAASRSDIRLVKESPKSLFQQYIEL